MGLLSRLRAWIGGVLGGDEPGDPPAEEAAEGPDESGAGEEPTGLDPNAATETRSGATDDAVDALRDVRRSREDASDGDGEKSGGDDGDGDERGIHDGDGDDPNASR